MAYHSAICISPIEIIFDSKLKYLYSHIFINLENITNVIFDLGRESTLENFYANKTVSILKKKSFLFIILFHISKLILHKVEGSS